MRTSVIVSFSLPTALLVEAKKLARRQHMTFSELMRDALRRVIEKDSKKQ